MQSMSARDAKNSFGKLIDMARAAPVAIEKHGRAVVVVLSVERYELLRATEGVHISAAATGMTSGMEKSVEKQGGGDQ
ncbi:type II toxin-antitoxin system Phd/YefM family antitoxin [Pseudomonas sp. Z13]|uniref:type II toxin-antitoxin system Phd/YefM family antitoxin n=1 Tax=Pseudomonas sp. Z13 TaxID=2983409 RepID=UPI002E813728|nr:type II toxin-antitoxin system Phd/YefM family antitoxin [Pseudomonas sp. Z13]